MNALASIHSVVKEASDCHARDRNSYKDVKSYRGTGHPRFHLLLFIIYLFFHFFCKGLRVGFKNEGYLFIYLVMLRVNLFIYYLFC